jgi:hypothetical protein
MTASDIVEEFELLQRQYATLFAEQMRAIKALAAELHEINAMYRQLHASVPHDELVNSGGSRNDGPVSRSERS